GNRKPSIGSRALAARCPDRLLSLPGVTAAVDPGITPSDHIHRVAVTGTPSLGGIFDPAASLPEGRPRLVR
ncbi:MAG: hypothetical protein ACK5Z4_12140, partial [Planctomyces sp.]